MTKAVKCSSCGLYYNGQVYSECPHCKATQEPAEKAEKGVNNTQQGNASNSKENQEPGKGSEIGRQKRYTVPYNKTQTGTEHWDDEKESPAASAKSEKTGKKDEQNPQQTEFAERLLKQLKESGKTVGKFTSVGDGKADPTVGWVVCVKGPYYGQSFRLHSGKNKIGRSQEFDVRLLNDDSVSRSCVASIVFDTKNSAFFIIPGDSDSLCYVSGEALYERRALTGYEQIELGDSERNMFVFVPLCGEHFNWLSYQAAK